MTLYVATDLTQRDIDLADIDPLADQPDLRINGQLYRALAPEYYAYLRHQMQRLKQAADAGKIAHDTYRPLADRFNTLHAAAVSLFGEETLRAALRSLNPQSYRVPGEGAEVIEVQPAPQRTWNGQGTLAGFDAIDTSATAPTLAGPVAIGQRVRITGTEVTITGYHPPDEDFPGGWIEVQNDAGVAGSADLRGVTDLSGRRLVPMILTAEEQRIAALPDEPFELTDADFDISDIPEPHYYPAGDDLALRCYQPVGPSAVAQVDAIRKQAMALGWTEAMLYQNRGRYTFPCGQDYGVVCHLGHQRRIGAVTAEAIEICHPTGSVLRCYRPTAPETTTKELHHETLP